MNERNRGYLTNNGDQYSMPNKQRNRLESDCKYNNFMKDLSLKAFKQATSSTSQKKKIL